ncbi:hypothetical protein AB0K15_15470 [Amycolatopsis sp. NPDC049253]|uniref:hypothetical protein n=1 Tax=Amycolatopsis sp. NPDC049253 TaxID=3155274 RepID=UPI0034186D5A
MQENRSFDHYFGTHGRHSRLLRPARDEAAERELRLPAALQRSPGRLSAAVPLCRRGPSRCRTDRLYCTGRPNSP